MDAFRVVSFNVCGVVCAEGRDDAAPFVDELVASTRATVVALQEVCRSQAEEVGRRLDGEVHYFSSVVGDFGGLNQCPGDDFGIALITMAPATESFIVELPNPGLGTTYQDERSLPCVVVGPPRDATVCTTHVLRRGADPATHDAQIAALREVIPQLASDREALIIAGDVNESVDAFADLPGIVTDDVDGVDHAFASRPPFDRVDVERHRCDCSDHEAIVATIRTS